MFIASAAVPALVVAACVAFGGLRGAVYNQLVQFLVLAAGFLPVIVLGMQKIGGLKGLIASLPTVYAASSAVSTPPSVESLVFAIALALLFGFSFWSSDFRAIQFALAAKDARSARRTSLIAAIFALVLPVLFVLPGIVAIALPTPHTSTSVRYENGAILRETTVVRPEVELGNGLVPARVDSATGKPILDPAGHPLLNYEMATPTLLLRVLPNGLLGLGLTALLASLMCGFAAGVTAINTVFVRDIYQRHLRKDSTDAHYLSAGRWTTFAGVLLATVLAFFLPDFARAASPLLLVFLLAGVPIFAIVLLGIFWKRATGHGAFAGLLAGAAAALLHHGLTLPANSNRGLSGGWLTVAHSYPNAITQSFSAALAAFVATLIVTIFVSALTGRRSASDLAGLVR
jgi:SSS family solute:Na+ symporter